jgi:hypothetical protein
MGGIVSAELSAADLLTEMQAQGFDLKVVGDRLCIRPVGRLTPELRDLLTRRKTELLARLAPPRGFVTLRPDTRTGVSLTVPVEAVELALDLERRGHRQFLDDQQQYQLQPTAGLTDRDRAAIARWRRHLAALVGYEAPPPE